MNVSGKVVILGILGMALAATGFGQWYHYSTTRRAMELWSAEAADQINRAPQVEALRLAPLAEGAAEPGDSGPAETIVFGGQTLRILEQADITAARGLIHARRALLEDANFDWDDDGGQCEPSWTYALRFVSADRTETLLLALDCHRIARLGDTRTVSLRPTITAGLTTFLGEQFPKASR